MNSLYTLGVRQTSSIQADLERLRSGESSASLLGQTHVLPRGAYLHQSAPGQVTASLAGMSRTIEDYDSMARREMIKAKQEKAFSYVLSLPDARAADLGLLFV